MPVKDTLVHGQHRLIYVGIAPQAPTKAGRESNSTLYKRITGNHLGRRIASSTLRRSLAEDELDLALCWNEKGKTVMPLEHEAALTGWMAKHAALSFVEFETAWHLEDELIAHGPPLPLNLKGSAPEFRAELMARRARPHT